MNFKDIACELGLASNQINAIYCLLCISSETTIDLKTLRMHSADLPQSLRDWIYLNNPEYIYFPGVSIDRDDNFDDWDLMEY